MIITQTPVRMSFFGGGTDYPSYFHKYGGETLVASVNQYTIITIHKLNNLVDYSIRVHYSKVESVGSIEEIQHPSARECLRYLKISGGIEIHYVSDLPARTGVGSSSSATVGLLHGLHVFKGESVNQQQIADEAIRVEQELIKDNVGCQDQYACALGGILHLQFQKNGQIEYSKLSLSPERLKNFQDRLLLFYTGDTRHSSEIVADQLARTEKGHNTDCLARMRSFVSEGKKTLIGNGDLHPFGELMHENWLLKKSLSKQISTPIVDEAYEAARKAGAIGGKLLGAGGGGFLLLFVEPESQDKVRQSLKKLREAKFAFENSGTQLVFSR